MPLNFERIRRQQRKIIAKRLVEARIDCDLSQEAAGKRVGLSRVTIANTELCRRGVATEELFILSCSYRVSIAWIVGEDAVSLAQHRVERKMKHVGKDDLDGE